METTAGTMWFHFDSTIMPKQSATDTTLAQRLGRLLRDDDGELDTFVEQIDASAVIEGTKTHISCNLIQLDGFGQPRVGDFAQWLSLGVLDYAIPRSQIKAAQERDQKFNTTRNINELQVKARALFNKLDKTGEGGEVLLYCLTQKRLGLPQLLCKMPLKTSANMHFHGIDGVHVGVTDSGSLALYWGESKLHKSLGRATAQAIRTIQPFLTATNGTGSAQDRDLYLMRDNLDVGDPKLASLLLDFLDRRRKAFNRVEFRGVCLVGFDLNLYPNSARKKAYTDLCEEVRQQLTKWRKSLAKSMKKKSRSPLASIHIEVFLVPFPSVDAFRRAFRKELTGV